MTTLLYSAHGTAGLVVHWLLLELGAPHEIRYLNLDAGEHKQPSYLALNPSGVVPTLVVAGAPICEAAAIVLHLADTVPAAGLAPAVGTVERGRYYQWMMFCANSLQPAYRAWFYADEPAGPEHAEQSRQAARARIEDCWRRVDAHLEQSGPYLLGARVSAADFMLTMLMRWSRHMPKPADTWASVGRLATLMKQRPSLAAVYRAEGITDWL